jgi:hypothetical protein
MELIYYKWLFERLTPHMIIECSGKELLNDLFVTWFRKRREGRVNLDFQNTLRFMEGEGLLKIVGKKGHITIYTPRTRRLNSINYTAPVRG